MNLQTAQRNTRITSKAPKEIIFHKPTITKNDLKSVMESLILDEISNGQVVQNFEKEVAQAFDYKKALSVQSLQSAYHLAFMALDVKVEDEIILPNNAPLAALDAIGQLQATPVLTDTERESFHPSCQQIIEKITDKTKVILLHYPYGSFRDYQELYDYLDEKKLKSISVVEDISYIAGMEYEGSYIGSKAKLSLIGLHQDMLMTIGKGAVLLTNSKPIYAIAKDLRYQGGSRPYRVRFDYTIPDYQAAMALEQLSLLTSGLERRRKMGKLYLEALLQQDFLETWFKTPVADSYSQFPVISKKPVEQTVHYFSSLNIEVQKLAARPFLNELIDLPSSDFPNSSRLYQRGVLLPLYPYLSKAHVQRIGEAIRAFV